MCGFAGIYSNQTPVSMDIAKRMTDIIRYRGPDDQYYAAFDFDSNYVRGIEVTESIDPVKGIVGFNRLSIRDLSLNGRQPMSDPDNRAVLVFNGEIYNTDYLKSFTPDWKYKSTSDTEVILALYLTLGLNKTVSLLNGMFAFAIVDLRTKKIILARDRMGIKPLYYSLTGGTLMFASEMKCFIQNPNFKRELNVSALEEFFTFGDAIFNTLLKNVYEVHPGEIITVDSDLRVSSTRYYDLNSYNRMDSSQITEAEALEQLEFLIKDSVKRQLVSDVKVGCQLSGGIDSSLVAYYADKVSVNNPVDSVSIIPTDSRYSEESYIRHVGQYISGERHYFSFDSDWFIKNFERGVWHYENIITYHNVIALMLLTAKAKQYVTVLLSGEGNDELWGGYTWFEDGGLVSQFFDNPLNVARPDVRGMSVADNYAQFAIHCTDVTPSPIAHQFLGTSYDREAIVKQREEYFQRFTGTDFDKHLKYEVSTRLVSLLMRQDKSSMSNSIENRVPLLDNVLIDFAFSIPQEYLLNRGDDRLIGKYLMKSLAAEIFGRDFAFRRKMGFPLPFHEYMYENYFKGLIYDRILPGIKRHGYLNYKNVKDAYESYSLSQNRWEFAPIFKAFCFELWCELFLDQNEVIL